MCRFSELPYSKKVDCKGRRGLLDVLVWAEGGGVVGGRAPRIVHEPGSRDVSVLSVQQDCKEHLLFSKNHNFAHGNRGRIVFR